MSTHSSATARAEAPHASTNNSISNAVKRRAQSIIKDKSVDANGRNWIRYALEINDPKLPELVRRADVGEPINDDSHLLEVNEEISTEEKVERLAEMICGPGDQPETRAAALLILMSTLENSTQPKALANHVNTLPSLAALS